MHGIGMADGAHERHLTATEVAYREANRFERRRLRVYVAGPISSGMFEGIHRGISWGRRMFIDGLAPYVPHFDALWYLPEGQWNAYLELDLEYVSVSDAVFRLSGESRGADKEAAVAEGLGIPVFYEDVPTDSEGFAIGRGYPELLGYADTAGLAGKRMVAL